MFLFAAPILLLFWIALISSVHGSESASNKPDFILPKYKRGVLVTNGVSTSCEMVPIGKVGAFVAASCLDNSKENSYTAYMSIDTDSNIVEKIDLSKDSITFHPDYNTETREYNMAIVKFNKDRVNEIDTRITDYTKSSNMQFIYSRIELDQGQSLLKETQFYMQNPRSDFTCFGALNKSEMYFRRSLCTTLKQRFDQEDKRELPYGSVLLTDGNTKYSYALYSHSILDISDPMNYSGPMYSFYSVLLYYAPFAKNVLGADLVFMIDGNPSIVPDNTTLYPIETKFNGTGGIFLFDDLYSKNEESIESYLPTPTEEPQSSVGETNQETHSIDQGSEANDSKSKKKLSSGAVAAIAIVVSIAGVVIIATAYRFIRIHLRNRSAEIFWDQRVDTL